MTTLWKRAAGAIKDRSSIVVAKFARKKSYRNADLESAIIKATSHSEYFIDRKNTHRVFAWVRASPNGLRTVNWAVSKRMEKTRSWVVAIKGLMLMHGVFCCKVPAVRKLGRLPFDLSSFCDKSSEGSKTWGFDAFIRAYFAYLDQRAVISFEQDVERLDTDDDEVQYPSTTEQLWKLQKWQSLLDLLLQIRPLADNMKVGLIQEALDCVIIEIFDVYSRICSEIAKVLLNIYSVGKLEAMIALKILQKATMQGEELYLYFELCHEYGVLNASEFPIVTQIPDEEFQELERIINGVHEKTYEDEDFKENNQMAIVFRDNNAIVEQQQSKKALQTIITDQWVIFDEHLKINGESNGKKSAALAGHVAVEDLPLIDFEVPVYNHYEIPDFITF